MPTAIPAKPKQAAPINDTRDFDLGESSMHPVHFIPSNATTNPMPPIIHAVTVSPRATYKNTQTCDFL